MKHGRIIILSGPSGSGKTTLYRKILVSPRLRSRVVKSTSATTRPPRAGEKHGRDYLFLSEKMFRYKERAGHFLESMPVFHHRYGTLHKTVREIRRRGKHVLLCIDVKGAAEVRRQHPDALTVFIKPPSMAELKKRLTRRGTETPKDLKKRLATARSEMAKAPQYDHVIVNDDLQKAYKKLETVLLQEIG